MLLPTGISLYVVANEPLLERANPYLLGHLDDAQSDGAGRFPVLNGDPDPANELGEQQMTIVLGLAAAARGRRRRCVLLKWQGLVGFRLAFAWLGLGCLRGLVLVLFSSRQLVSPFPAKLRL